jgi:glycosyltransferase involved in cell wall biosynthesis
MEAMSVGLPVVANKVGALPELLADGRGWIVEPTDWNYDPFGNQKRYDISIKGAVEALLDVRKSKGSGTDTTHKARKFMESRSWERSAQQVNNALEEIFEASEVDKNGV